MAKETEFRISETRRQPTGNIVMVAELIADPTIYYTVAYAKDVVRNMTVEEMEQRSLMAAARMHYPHYPHNKR